MNYLLPFLFSLVLLLSTCSGGISSAHTEDRSTPYIEVFQVPDSSKRINIYQIAIFFPERTPVFRGIEGTSFSSGLSSTGKENITLVVEISEEYSQDRSEEYVLLRTAYYYEGGGIYSSSRKLEEVEDIRFISVDRYTRGISTGRFELLPEEKFLLGSSEISQLMITVKADSE